MDKRVVLVLLILAMASAASYGAPRLVTDSYNLDLGRLRGGVVADKIVTLRNEGDQPLEIQKIQSSCPCLTVVAPEQPTIAPGGSLALTFQYDTKDAVGERQASIAIDTNDPKEPVAVFELKVFVDVLMLARPPEGILWGAAPRGHELIGKNRVLTLMPGVDKKDIELIDIHVEHPGVQVKTEKEKQTDDRWRIKARFTIAPDVPLGRLSTFVVARARVGDEEASVRLPLQGEVIGDVLVAPPSILSAPKLSYRKGDRISEIMVRSSLENTPPPDILGVVAVGPISTVIHKFAQENKHIIAVHAGTAARPGPQGATVYVMTDSRDQPITSIPVHFIIAPEVAAEPATVVLTPVPGAPASQSVAIKSVSGSTLTIKDVRFESDIISVQVTAGQQTDTEHPASIAITADRLPDPTRRATLINVVTDSAAAPELLVPVLLR